MATGAWPLFHLKSFAAVTGPKEDEWLVKTIAWIFILSGAQLWRSADEADARLLGLGWPAIIGGADIYYTLIRKRIRNVYLLDAVLQAGFILAWLMPSRRP